MFKKTADMSASEIMLNDMKEIIDDLEIKLSKLESVVDKIYFKAGISECLMVVKKISKKDYKAAKKCRRTERNALKQSGLSHQL